MVVPWRTFILLLSIFTTFLSCHGRHHMRHGHGFRRLKHHLHRLHLKHLKNKMASESTTMQTSTELPRIQKMSTEPLVPTSGILPTTVSPAAPVLRPFDEENDEDAADLMEAKIEAQAMTPPDDGLQRISGDGNTPKISRDDQDSNHIVEIKDDFVNYDELKKSFKYDNKSTLPILDKPVNKVMNVTDETPGEDKEDFRPVELPKRFVSYDKNRDGFISKKELVDVTGAAENSDKAFEATDKNNDGYISPEEFISAPWILEDDPDQNAELVQKRAYLKHRMEALEDMHSIDSDDTGNVYSQDWYPLHDD